MTKSHHKRTSSAFRYLIFGSCRDSESRSLPFICVDAARLRVVVLPARVDPSQPVATGRCVAYEAANLLKTRCAWRAKSTRMAGIFLVGNGSSLTGMRISDSLKGRAEGSLDCRPASRRRSRREWMESVQWAERALYVDPGVRHTSSRVDELLIGRME